LWFVSTFSCLWSESSEGTTLLSRFIVRGTGRSDLAHRAISPCERRAMPTLKTLASHLKSTEASEIAEAAMVLPLVFMLVLGIIWFGRAFNVYSTIQQAAQQGAIAAARDSCATCGSAPLSQLPAAGTVDTAVSNVLQADNLSLSQIQTWKANTPTPGLVSCPLPAPPFSCNLSANKIWVCSSVLLNSATQPAQCGAVVSFKYPFSFNLLSLTSLGSVTMSAQAQSRMEN